jgi:hypothetical protein
MKDKCNGKAQFEFVGLLSKMYNLLTYDDNMAKRTAKGIKERYIAKHLRHDKYLRTLREKTIEHAQYRLFRLRVHKIKTLNIRRSHCALTTTSDSYRTTALRRWRTVTCGCRALSELWHINSGRCC